METIDFQQNYNGKLFCQCFNDVVLNTQQYQVGQTYTLTLKGLELGKVQVVALHVFPFQKISDPISFLTTGKPAVYLAQLLRRGAYTATATIPELLHIVFQYQERNITNHQQLLQAWWKEVLDGSEIDLQPDYSSL